MGVLDGTRVVHFGRYIAGPYCGALLGDLGAEVIRVERVDGGEDRWITPVTTDGVGAMFLQCNRGKRGMTLDVTRPEGREVVARLIGSADVVIANLPGDTLRSMLARPTVSSVVVGPQPLPGAGGVDPDVALEEGYVDGEDDEYGQYDEYAGDDEPALDDGSDEELPAPEMNCFWPLST